MNNLLSYCELTDSKMRASGTDLPVINTFVTWPDFQTLDLQKLFVVLLILLQKIFLPEI